MQKFPEAFFKFESQRDSGSVSQKLQCRELAEPLANHLVSFTNFSEFKRGTFQKKYPGIPFAFLLPWRAGFLLFLWNRNVSLL